MAKNLVLLRCGRNSLHQNWLRGAPPAFDLVLCPYQDVPQDPDAFWQSATIEGQKWTGLHRLLTEWPHWRDYDYIWLPDDDLEADARGINALFALSQRFNAKISAPALAGGSYHSHVVTMQNRSFFARAVAFVEIMMPCLRRDVLDIFLPSIGASKSGLGWGLDYAWPAIINYENMLIFDSVTVRHTRPVGALRDRALHDEGVADMNALRAEHGNVALYKVRGAYAANGELRAADSKLFLLDYLDGYRYLIERDENLLEMLIKFQNTEMPAGAAPPHAPGETSGRNIARGKPASMSSVWPFSCPPGATLADCAAGGNNGRITGGAGFHTDCEKDPWWQVDLEACYAVTGVSLYNRLDLPERCTRVSVSASMDGQAFEVQAAKLDDRLFGGADGRPHVFSFSPAFQARFVRITLIGENYLHLDEVEIFGDRAE